MTTAPNSGLEEQKLAANSVKRTRPQSWMVPDTTLSPNSRSIFSCMIGERKNTEEASPTTADAVDAMMLRSASGSASSAAGPEPVSHGNIVTHNITARTIYMHVHNSQHSPVW
jgi:hypothetical protein